MEEVCFELPKFREENYEWASLMVNFHREIQKSEHNWWPWVTGACFYHDKVRRQIQIVMSELLIHNGIDPWQILSTELSDQFDTLPIAGQKAMAKIYCAKLIYIVQESIKRARN